MSRTGTGKRSLRPEPSAEDARCIDELYGLEPVFEPASVAEGSEPPVGTEARTVRCPYCGEGFETLLDLSAGSASYVEDCQVCCRPIEFNVSVDDTGALLELTVLRGD